MVGFVFAEMDFYLQHCVHVCNDGSLFAGMYLCWQQWVYNAYLGLPGMSAVGKQGWCGIRKCKDRFCYVRLCVIEAGGRLSQSRSLNHPTRRVVILASAIFIHTI
jgi:hypothetical protein